MKLFAVTLNTQFPHEHQGAADGLLLRITRGKSVLTKNDEREKRGSRIEARSLDIDVSCSRLAGPLEIRKSSSQYF